MWHVLGEKIHTGFWFGNQRKETTLEDSSLDEKTILTWTFKETGQKNMDWPHLTQNRDKRRFLVNKVTILRIPKNAKNFLTSRRTISFSRESIMELINA